MIEILNTGYFLAFLVGLALGAGATLNRVAFYRKHGFTMPRLLPRDAHLIGGFALSFGLFLTVSLLRVAGVDTSGLANNVLWIVVSRTPAIWAVAVYAYFEIFVIEHSGSDPRERPE